MHRKLALGKENRLQLPETPELKRLGYGTGVGIFRVPPSSTHSNSPWAMKRIMRSTNSDLTMMSKRLRDEADILKKLNHPNIVGFRAFTTMNDGRECLVMEACHMSLFDIIEAKGVHEQFSVDVVSKVAFEIAKALDYIHNTIHLLHGDIKSANILVKGNFDTVKLCDFGVTLPLKADGSLDSDKAGKDAVYIGTALWHAPEVCDRSTCYVITDKADIFAYGLTIWELLAKDSPHCPKPEDDSSFEDSSLVLEMMDELIGTRPPLPEWVRSDAAYSNVLTLFTGCTEENYKNRYSATDVLQFCLKNNVK